VEAVAHPPARTLLPSEAKSNLFPRKPRYIPPAPPDASPGAV
jgi:hypothetical protein